VCENKIILLDKKGISKTIEWRSHCYVCISLRNVKQKNKFWIKIQYVATIKSNLLLYQSSFELDYPRNAREYAYTQLMHESHEKFVAFHHPGGNYVHAIFSCVFFLFPQKKWIELSWVENKKQTVLHIKIRRLASTDMNMKRADQ
jgi:hypothetical protein